MSPDSSAWNSRGWSCIAISVVALLSSCSSEGEQAEKRYEMVKRTGTNGEICDAGKTVTQAYLKASNEEKYKWWHMISDGDA